ncbi:hypothetical protein CHK_0423 [Christensenella hongkongensis]|uniref:Uncharacterized protein n=1 Tax=Christensenella hongkongensis TaxID=270498 RepID=A0A0M2NNU6_9FIRM|nr:hypothetical protein CHK_0423 [Christensenella hongkongensis]
MGGVGQSDLSINQSFFYALPQDMLKQATKQICSIKRAASVL